MHMADALLSPAVGTAMYVASTSAIAYSTVKMKKEMVSDKKLPLMAVTGAFVFAAQMINFTIPATGSSGHIGGGILLAGLLGGFPAFLTVAAVLTIQALFFADGGLIALGCNIFNLGVIPCLVVYPLLFKPMMKKQITNKNITIASIITVVIGLQLGSLGVVLETLASGVTALPFTTFLLMMQPIHLAIGIVEGIVTASILCFVHSMRPEILESANTEAVLKRNISLKKVLLTLGILTLIVGGIFSSFASAYPDGLEWSIEKVAGTPELEAKGQAFEVADRIQQRTAIMPDYDYATEGKSSGTPVAGIVGSLLTFGLAGLIGFIITKMKHKKKEFSING